MARVIFNAKEIDQEFQIEDGIRRMLEQNSVASIEQSVIDKCYALEDEDATVTSADIDDKCRQIAERGNLDYSLHEDLAIFRRKRK